MRTHLIAALFATLAIPASATELVVTTVVDTTFCASGAVQCTVPGSGHTAAVANSSNSNPIRLFVTVSREGNPVSGLTISNFNVSNGFVPAGGGAATICTSTICGSNRFGGGSQGTYQIILDRVGTNWKRGSYLATTKVTSGTDVGISGTMFTIPAP